MSLDYPNYNDWLKVRDLQRYGAVPRLFWDSASNGTYVRKRANPEENARLTKFANRCNGRFRDRQARRRKS